jgi:hypothetical protein
MPVCACVLIKSNTSDRILLGVSYVGPPYFGSLALFLRGSSDSHLGISPLS